MGKKVVDGGPIRFKDDLPIAAGEIPRPLGLPPVPLFRDELTIAYKARLFVLDRAAGEDYAQVWRHTYGLRETEPADAVEARWFADHRAAIDAAQDAWLRRVLPGTEPAPGVPAQIVRALEDKVRELCAPPARPPRPDVGTGRVTRRPEASLLAALSGFERVLVLDDKLYELLSLAEYLGRFEKAFEPAFLQELQKACETEPPAAICARMKDGLDRLDKRTFGVLRGKLHYDERTFELRLDGVHLVPEYLAPAGELLDRYRAQVETRVKIEALERLVK